MRLEWKAVREPLECKECEADDNVREISEMIDTRVAR